MVDRYRLLKAPRAPTILVVVVSALLCIPPQLRDMLQTVNESFPGAASFQLSLFLLAFLTWLWSRTALNFAVGCRDGASRAVVLQECSKWEARYWTWWPRILLGMVGLDGCVIALRSAAWSQLLISSTGIGLLLFLLVSRRRNKTPVADTAPVHAVDAAPLGTRTIAHASVVLGVIAFVFASVNTFLDPLPLDLADLVAHVFPGPGAAIACFTLIIGPLSFLTIELDGPWRLPFGRDGTPVPPLVLMLVLVGWSETLTLHPVRIVRHPFMPPDSRIQLTAAFRSWVDACGANAPRVEPIVVALSGGASRAGLWSARALRAIDIAAQQRSGGIFAISSVSGGSLGAADYVTRRGAPAPGSHCRLPDEEQPLDVQKGDDAVIDHFAGDLLGPLLANTILNDSARGLLSGPLSLFVPDWPPRAGDRAAGLERAFERAWRQGGDPLAAPFLSVFYGGSDKPAWKPGMPIWISNGTDVMGGERLITIPIQPYATPDHQLDLLKAWPFEGAKDVLSLLGEDVPVSTAIHNSARFPFLSPVGTLVPGRTEVRPAAAQFGERPAEISDGGYFENSGVTTAFELVQWLHDYGPELLGRNGEGPHHLDVDPILVVVDADAEPSVGSDDVPRCAGGASRDPGRTVDLTPTTQLLAPLLSLYNVRAGHGNYAIQKVRERLCNHLINGVQRIREETPKELAVEKFTPSFFNFYLHADPKAGEIPLNWVLSREVEHRIWNNMTEAADNNRELVALQEKLKAETAALQRVRPGTGTGATEIMASTQVSRPDRTPAGH